MHLCVWGWHKQAWVIWQAMETRRSRGSPAATHRPGAEVDGFQQCPGSWEGQGAHLPCGASSAHFKLQHWDLRAHQFQGVWGITAMCLPPKWHLSVPGWHKAGVTMQLVLLHLLSADCHHCCPCHSGVLQDVRPHLSHLVQRFWWDLSLFNNKGLHLAALFQCYDKSNTAKALALISAVLRSS